MDENLSITALDKQTNHESSEFVCGICNERFTVNEHYVTHLKTHEPLVVNISSDVDLLDDSVSSIKDDLALNEVALNEVLSQSQVSSEKPKISCINCPQTFTSLLDLECTPKQNMYRSLVSFVISANTVMINL